MASLGGAMALKDQLGVTQEPLFLMDGTAFMFRAFYTGRNMQRSDGLRNC
ncbi:MAG: hypothetical protein IJU79_04210 [Desulfovibrionaceae bacterium]|nr:hypothetical protein [Desulfovibrionaceae bacterium]